MVILPSTNISPWIHHILLSNVTLVSPTNMFWIRTSLASFLFSEILNFVPYSLSGIVTYGIDDYI